MTTTPLPTAPESLLSDPFVCALLSATTLAYLRVQEERARRVCPDAFTRIAATHGPRLAAVGCLNQDALAASMLGAVGDYGRDLVAALAAYPTSRWYAGDGLVAGPARFA